MVCVSLRLVTLTDRSQDPQLAQRALRLVLWSLYEEKGKGVVIAALQLCVNPHIATSSNTQRLTYKAAQLLLADGVSLASS